MRLRACERVTPSCSATAVSSRRTVRPALRRRLGAFVGSHRAIHLLLHLAEHLLTLRGQGLTFFEERDRAVELDVSALEAL